MRTHTIGEACRCLHAWLMDVGEREETEGKGRESEREQVHSQNKPLSVVVVVIIIIIIIIIIYYHHHHHQ
jgi:hypothetical protein